MSHPARGSTRRVGIDGKANTAGCRQGEVWSLEVGAEAAT